MVTPAQGRGGKGEGDNSYPDLHSYAIVSLFCFVLFHVDMLIKFVI